VEQQDSSLGPDGRAFYSLEPGDWHLILSSPALGLQERDLVVEPDDIHLIEIDAGLLRSEGTSRLTVRVVDPAERPVAGASILMDGQEAGTTSTEGNLLLSGLAEGTHLLRVEGPFFLAHEIELELKNEGEVILKLSWQGSPVRVAARAQGQPVLDAWVRMFGDTTTAEQPVGVDGTHLFVVEPGSWVAVASSSVLGIGERDLQVAPSQREQEAVVEIQPPLEAKARLEVSVVDSQGQPVEGAVLMLDQLVMVAPYGAVTFPDRPVGAVPLKVEAAGYVPWSEPRLALIEGNQSRRVVLKALPRTVSLQITDAEGQPVAVGVRLSQGKKAVQSMSGAELSLQPGRWQVLVSATDTLGAWQGEWVVEPGKGVQALTVQLKPSRVEVAAQEVRIREQVFFAFDRAVLDPRSDAVLAEVAATLLLHPEITRLEVQGHTDNLGGAEYNLELSRRRAEAVRDRLIRLGVDPARLVAVGYGSNKPKASNNSEVGRQQNRRVQFEILHEPAKPE
jgi:outer membrane protein OmpA-like peptidoglycan-associated protein